MNSGSPQQQTVRVAAIDMGSNTTRLLVADVAVGADGVGEVTAIVEQRSIITRLAQGVDKRKELHPEAIARARNALVEFKGLAREAGAVFVLMTATSAVRDADNGEAFLGEVEYSYGFRTDLLSGNQECEMMLRGLKSDPKMRELLGSGRVAVIDIGGGSTEIVVHDGSARESAIRAASLQLGSVRVTERCFVDHDPPTADEVAAASRLVENEIAAAFLDAAACTVAIGVAGTVTTIAAVHLQMGIYDPNVMHGTQLARGTVDDVCARLATTRCADRAAMVGIEPDRAPVIVGGSVILRQFMHSFGVETLTVSERDILFGIAAYAGEIAISEGITELPEPHGRTVC